MNKKAVLAVCVIAIIAILCVILLYHTPQKIGKEEVNPPESPEKEELKPKSSPYSQTVRGETVEGFMIFEQKIKFSIGDRIVLGKITDELADLGTIKKGDKASYNITVKNNKDEVLKVFCSIEGNASEFITVDCPREIGPLSSANVTIAVNARGDYGYYEGKIIIKGCY